ncbi:hypothetical protein ZWY2020_035811 [Hordeum vulgare]|nr:hypothetical protein ZWY2020_035811 [Hordeum vulgare]
MPWLLPASLLLRHQLTHRNFLSTTAKRISSFPYFSTETTRRKSFSVPSTAATGAFSSPEASSKTFMSEVGRRPSAPAPSGRSSRSPAARAPWVSAAGTAPTRYACSLQGDPLHGVRAVPQLAPRRRTLARRRAGRGPACRIGRRHVPDSHVPLDLARTRLACRATDAGVFGVLRRAYAEGGVRGLYRGVCPSLARVLPTAGLRFYVYESLKRRLPEEYEGAWIQDGMRGGGGSGRQRGNIPLDVVRRQMQLGGTGTGQRSPERCRASGPSQGRMGRSSCMQG